MTLDSPILFAAVQAQQPSMWPSLLMMGVIFGIFYLLVFAPMRKKQKKHAEMLGHLRAGDRVITNGGILGTVKALDDHTVQLRVAEQVTIEVARSAIAALQETEKE